MAKNKGCKVKDCKVKHGAIGFCLKHYTAFYKGFILEDGTFLPHYNPRPIFDRCKYPQCGVPKIKGNGLCQKHYKRAQSKRIDWETCAVLDKEWHKVKSHYFEKIKGVEIALLRTECKLSKCKNKDLKGRGLCGYHYSRFQNKFISESGDRLAKPLVRYREDFVCAIPECSTARRDSKMVKGLCRYHYARYSKGYIDYNGFKLKEDKRVASYKGVSCKMIGCAKQARSKGFCARHYEQMKNGYIDLEGKKLKKIKAYNVGKKCKVDGCKEKAHCKLMCSHHYNKWKYHGTLENMWMNKGHLCSEEGCDKPAYSRSVCSTHWRLLRMDEKGIPRWNPINKGKMCKHGPCRKDAEVKGYCNMHYAKLRNHGDVNYKRVLVNDGPCKIKECEVKSKTGGYCSKHHYWLVEKPRREREYGSLEGKKGKKDTGTRKILENDSIGEDTSQLQ